MYDFFIIALSFAKIKRPRENCIFVKDMQNELQYRNAKMKFVHLSACNNLTL